jgi:hypothetical protein
VFGDFTSDVFDVRKISGSVRRGRRADGEEDYQGLLNSGRTIGGKSKPSGLQIFLNKLIEARLVNCRLPESELGYLLGIYVDASDIHAELSKTCSGYKSHITGANDGNVHSLALTYLREFSAQPKFTGHARH